LLAHLADCPVCQAALAAAQQQQRLLAAAARVQVPAEPFVPPTEPANEPANEAVQLAPANLPKPFADRPARRRNWRRWAVAAGLRLVVVGPRTVQSGAPTVFQVRTTDLNDQPAAAEIVAQVADEQAADVKKVLAASSVGRDKPGERGPKAKKETSLSDAEKW